MKVVAATAVMVALAGWVVVSRSGASWGSKSSTPYGCVDGSSTEVVPASLWILWIVLVLLVVVLKVLHRRLVQRDRLSTLLWRCGLASAVLLFPTWLAVASDFNCAL